MPVELEQLRKELGVSKDREDQLRPVLDGAYQLLYGLVDVNTLHWSIADQAVILIAGDLWYLKQAPNGVRNFADLNGSSLVRVNRDPTARARGLLAPWMKAGLA